MKIDQLVVSDFKVDRFRADITHTCRHVKMAYELLVARLA
jgi:hypothetical protein